MAEKNLNGRLLKALREFHPVRIENSCANGTPDLNYAYGWIESKYLARWPTNPELIVRLDHFTPQQKLWHIMRQRGNGVSYIVLQVADEILLFSGATAAHYLGQSTRAQLYSRALKRWTGREFTSESFLDYIVTE